MNIIDEQKMICDKYGSDLWETKLQFKIGVALNVKSGNFPIHGLRLNPESDTAGWFIWAGDYSTEPDFFKPVHVEHLRNWNPWIVKYLGLAPGWRFLVTYSYEDVWFDPEILRGL